MITRRKFMQEEKDSIFEEDEQPQPIENEPSETVENPVPGIKYENEPDAENIMPVEDGPGTF
jgi:hypothetical protein